MKKTAQTMDLWKAVSILITAVYLLFLVIPLLAVLRESVILPDGSLSFEYFQRFFREPYYLNTILNSFKISLATMFLSLLVGVPLAYFYSLYHIRGEKMLQIFIILSSMSAPFVGAYAWILLLGRSGLITKFALSAFGVRIPTIYGFSGIVLVLTTRLFPLVFMYVVGALKNVDRSLLEASLNMGCSGVKRFWKVVLPLCMPSILASALMVFMRAMADFGTPLMIGEGYRTFPVEIYKQYVGETSRNHSFAAAISVIAIIITAVVFLLQKLAAKSFSFQMNALHRIEKKKGSLFFSAFIHLYSYLVIAVAMLPQIYLIYCSFRKTNAFGNFVPGFSLGNYSKAWTLVRQSLPNTLIIGGVSLALVILLSILIAYLVVRRQFFLNHVIDTMSMIPYIIPGSVVGIALVLAFSGKPLVLTGTMAIMVISMCIRRLPYSIRSSVAVLQQIPITTEEAGISLGASKLRTLFRVTVPMMSSGIVSGAILSWVSIMTELSSSIMLYSAKTQTLTLSIYVFVSRGTDGAACAVSTILLLFTVISLLIFMLSSRNNDISL